MFKWIGKKKETATIVRTKKELKEAVNRGCPSIEVRGDLVSQIKWMAKLSKAQRVALLSLPALALMSGPISPASAFAVLSVQGTAIAKIILAGGFSTAMIIGVLKEYDVIIVKDDMSLILTRR